MERIWPGQVETERERVKIKEGQKERKKDKCLDLRGSPVVRNPPADAGDMS